jgi:hypothetical protein
MSTKWTPGPWNIGYNGGVTGSGACCHGWHDALKAPVVYSGQGEYYANNPHRVILISAPSGGSNLVVAHAIPEPDSCFGGVNGDANARLIAAAPELYDACEAIAYESDRETSSGRDVLVSRERFEKVLAALAKARGEA